LQAHRSSRRQAANQHSGGPVGEEKTLSD